MENKKREKRAAALAKYGTIRKAVSSGVLTQFQDLSVSEALVLGLYNQGVTKYVGVFGHGTTDIAEVLRIYSQIGLTKVYNIRHETAAAHAVTALKIQTGETAAVITSIGPGALHAFAGSLCAASNGAGVYHIYGDETTHDEGFNFQQIPKDEQGLFLKMCSIMGNSYALYEPCSIFTALRRGSIHTGKEGFSGPFFLLAPMNVQSVIIKNCNLLEFPSKFIPEKTVCENEKVFRKASELSGNRTLLGTPLYVCRRFQRLHFRELLHERGRSGHYHWSTGRLPVGLFRNNLEESPEYYQFQP